MSTAIKEKVERKLGERVDVTVKFDIGDVELGDLNEKVYANEITEKEWKSEVKKRLAQKGLNYGEFDAIISNSGTDRHGEQILLEGIDTSQMKVNAPMPWSHDYMNLPLGKWIKIWKSGGNLMGRGRMDYDIYDFADLAYKMLLRGTLNAISIGGIVKEFDDKDYSIIKKLEMVEASLVLVGAHPEAMVVSRSLNISEKTVKSKFQEFIKSVILDKTKSVPHNELQQTIKSLELLLDHLKEAHTEVQKSDKEESEQTRKVKMFTLKKTAQQLNAESVKTIKLIKLKEL